MRVPPLLPRYQSIFSVGSVAAVTDLFTVDVLWHRVAPLPRDATERVRRESQVQPIPLRSMVLPQ